MPLVIPTTGLPGGATGLRAGIDGHPGLFLFDTGAGVTLVMPERGVASGCRPWGQVTGFRATGERMTPPRCDDVRLAIGGRSFAAPTAAVLDLQRMMPPGMPRLSVVLALDVFAGHAITIRPMAHELVVETLSSLRPRTVGAREVPVRLVQDAEGLAPTVDGAVPTPAGRAWMELDTGNGGPVMVDEHVATPLGRVPENRNIQPMTATLASDIPVRGRSAARARPGHGRRHRRGGPGRLRSRLRPGRRTSLVPAGNPSAHPPEVASSLDAGLLLAVAGADQ